MKEELENLKAQIHFKENGIPSIHAGYLTDETITSIINLVDRELPKKIEPTSDEFLAYNHGFNNAIDQVRAIIRSNT